MQPYPKIHVCCRHDNEETVHVSGTYTTYFAGGQGLFPVIFVRASLAWVEIRMAITMTLLSSGP